jgi:CubicO group peptidase (beta-lactamase class C family)
MIKKSAFLVLLFFAVVALADEVYFPESGADWKRRKPEEAGFDPGKLKEAIEFAVSNETKSPRDLAFDHYQTLGGEPFGESMGPFQERGDPAGIVLRNGYIIAEWGDPHRVDMTFSVTKSFVSTTVGLAMDRGLIRDINEPVHKSMGPITLLRNSSSASLDAAEKLHRPEFLNLFNTELNRQITWDHLLRQTSDWEGTLWGKPDWADRPGEKPEEWLSRKRNPPGSAYEYNDVRVNLLALLALNIWRRPLPQVLKEYVMDPIGASHTWRWHGYENSWVLIDGVAMQSVSGGGHWGGGMFISARDMARFGYLTLRRGKWKDKRILSQAWIRMALTSTPVQLKYGFMNFFLNTDRKLYPSAPASAFAHLGYGSNMIFVDPDHDLVVVARWINGDVEDAFLQRILSAIRR